MILTTTGGDSEVDGAGAVAHSLDNHLNPHLRHCGALLKLLRAYVEQQP